MIKTAIIGYGYAAKTFHLPFIATMDEFSLAAISTSKDVEARASWPGVEIFSSADALIQNTDAELIIITAPNDVHYHLAKLALEYNKHVILEKPFVTHLAQGQELIRLASDRNLVLSVYHNRRWDGDFLTIKKLINSAKLGEIRYFESHFDRFRPEVRQRWREQPGAGTGTWYDLGAHLVDQALCLFGPPQAVTGRCLALRPGSVVTDYFHVLLHYPDKEVVLQASPFSAGPVQRFHLQGTEGSYIKYGMDPQEDRLRAGQKPLGETWAMEEPSAYGKLYTATDFSVVTTEAGGYHHYYQGVANSIGTGSPLPVMAEEALNSIRIIETAVRSCEEGRTLTLSGARLSAPQC